MGGRASAGNAIGFQLGPFIGLYDSPDPVEKRRREIRSLYDSLNMVFADVARGGNVLARHGFLGAQTQLGDTSGRTGQGFCRHRRTDGSLDNYKFVGGKMYRWGGTDTPADDVLIDTSAVTIDRTNRVFAVSFNNGVVISDETNRPWIYSPDTGTCVPIQYNTINDDWSTQGGPQIRDGRIWFIAKGVGAQHITTELDERETTEDDVEITTELLAAYQNTVVYSEPLDATTGYLQDNYNNKISLVQSSDEILTAIDGEEEYLVYFRQIGISGLAGKTVADFQTSATRDSISTSSGTDCPASITRAHNKIWYLDMDGRVMRIPSAGGGEPEQLYFPMRRVIDSHVGRAANRADVKRFGCGAFHEGYGLVLFTIWDRQTVYAFDATSGVYVGRMVFGGDDGASIHVDTMGTLIDANNRATFMLIGTRTSTYDVTTQGVVWRQKHDDDANEWLDQADSSSATCIPLTRKVKPHGLNDSAAESIRVTHVAAEVSPDTARHAVGLVYSTPSGGHSARIVAQSTAVASASAQENVSRAAWSLGKNAQGSSVFLELSATHSDNVRWGLHSIDVDALITKVRTNAR